MKIINKVNAKNNLVISIKWVYLGYLRALVLRIIN